MSFLLLIFVAAAMAVFATFGFLRGAKAMAVALLILFVTCALVEKRPDLLIKTVNGMYMGTMLVLKGGLGDIAAGDFDAISETFQSIEPLIQTEQQEAHALVLIILGAVGIGLLISHFLQGKHSILGGVLGLAYGYLLSAAILPLLFDVPASSLPIPLLRPIQDLDVWVDRLIEALAKPENIQIAAIAIAIGIVLVVILSLTYSRRSKRG